MYSPGYIIIIGLYRPVSPTQPQLTSDLFRGARVYLGGAAT